MGWATRENVSGQVLPAGPAAQQQASVPGGESRPAPGDSHQVRAAVAAERARIAREMDDTVSKSLLGISMVAASLATAPQAADRQAVEQQLRELTRLARRAVADARLRHPWPAGGTAARRSAERRDGLGHPGRHPCQPGAGPGGEVSADVRCEIVAILREALRNVEQHARASQVRVVLRRTRGLAVLTVADDGTGHRPPADLAELRAARLPRPGRNQRARPAAGRTADRRIPAGRGNPPPGRDSCPGSGPAAAPGRIDDLPGAGDRGRQ